MTAQVYLRGMPVGVAQAIKGAFDWPNSIGLTATGSTQGTAVLMPRDFNVFTTVGSGTGCILPWGNDQVVSVQATASGNQSTYGTAEIGDTYAVINSQATNALLVYPQLGGKSSLAGSANAGLSVAANKGATFQYLGSGNWFSDLSN